MTVRFETPPGKQAQVDWGSSQVWFGEERVRIRFFVTTLGYSRRMFVRAFLNERLGSLIEAHEEASLLWRGHGRSPSRLFCAKHNPDRTRTAVVSTHRIGFPRISVLEHLAYHQRRNRISFLSREKKNRLKYDVPRQGGTPRLDSFRPRILFPGPPMAGSSTPPAS